ncbi:MAG: methyltransferase domain-containing protein [Chlamydiae bacterium]|nr:methyltransferase domain-containing protein [Chlamydiota bacterium]
MKKKDASQLWKEEYRRKGIPSSYREDPTKTLIHFTSFLESKELLSGKALDLGCGRGRNAFYLASKGYSVTCLDLVSENIDEINRRAIEMKLPITAFCQVSPTHGQCKTNNLTSQLIFFATNTLQAKKKIIEIHSMLH